MKVRRKVEELEAIQWFKDGDHPNVKEQTESSHVWVKGHFYIGTKHGNCTLVRPGDWIVTDSKGSHFVLNKDEFNTKYELI